jgi:hypothetical protein
MTPIQLPDESQRAFAAFKKYVAMGDKRSIRAVCRKHGKDRATCEKWSKKYRWQERLRELELDDCRRAVKADEVAKLSLAEERAREQIKFQQRALEASKRATARALQILKQSAKGSKPSDAARLLAVADMIGRAALELTPSGSGAGAFRLNPTAAPVFRVVLRRDAKTDERRRLEDKFFAEHPEIKRPKNGLELLPDNFV